MAVVVPVGSLVFYMPVVYTFNGPAAAAEGGNAAGRKNKGGFQAWLKVMSL